MIRSQLGDARQHLANDTLASLDGRQQVEPLGFKFRCSGTGLCQGCVRGGRTPTSIVGGPPADDGLIALMSLQPGTQGSAVFRGGAGIAASLAEFLGPRQPPFGGCLGIGAAHACAQPIEVLFGRASLVAERMEVVRLPIQRDCSL